MSRAIIVAENVDYTYGAGTHSAVEALRGISLTILEGEYVAIVGHNGSGKSTLAKCLNGLLIPATGEVRVNGLSTRDPDARYVIRATVGMVFQNPDNQFVASTVQEEVAFGPENLGLPREQLVERVHTALEQTRLAGSELRNPSHLSAGQKSRLAIASILAMRPTCLVLDESTAMLAPRSRRQILALLKELCHQGLTIITITHHMEEATHADRIIVLDHGTIACQGTPRHVFADEPAILSIGLALPPASAIARGLSDRGLLLRPGILTRDELVDAVLHLQGEMA